MTRSSAPTEDRAAPSASSPIASCAVAVDVALLTVADGRLRLLLVEPDRAALAGRWALPGRRVREDESLDDTAHRALRELAGIEVPSAILEQLRTYGDADRDPRGRVVSVAYLALSAEPFDPDPSRTARVVDVADLGMLEPERFAYDHDRIVADAIERTRARLEYTSLATAFVP
jgi:8-oxo-dGTP diphosphatase